MTYASGKWKERRYNDRLQTVANVYSSVNTPDVFVSPNELGTIIRAEDAGGLVYDYGIRPLGQLLTNEVVTSPWMNWRLSHSHDQCSRESGLALTVDGEPKGRSSWHYDAEGRFAGLVCTNSHGRAIEVRYVHDGSRICGYSVRMPAGESYEQVWDRDEYRRELMKKLTVKFSGAVLLERSCEYDAAGRLTHWADVGTTYEGAYRYGRRKEIVQADVTGVRYGYGFDSSANCIGFSIGWWKLTENGSSKFLPGWGDAEIKGLIEEAFAAAKKQGKIKPSELDGFIYDAGRLVGASKGNKTTRIKIHVNNDGRNLHAFPVP